MTARRRSIRTARNLDRLDDRERSAVLSKLLATHPELVAEADDLASRAGRHRGGYVEPNEAAWALIEEAFEPFLIELRRLAELGHLDAATATARGALDGLDRLGEPSDGTVLAWSGPDTLDHLAEAVRPDAKKLGMTIDEDE